MTGDHCAFCKPCCCRGCNPWFWFVVGWTNVALAIRNPNAARWLLGEAT